MLGRVSDCTFEHLNTRNVWNKWHTSKRRGNDNLTGSESPRIFVVLGSSLNSHLPVTCSVLRSSQYSRVSPSGELHSTSIPFEPVTHLAGWSVCWPVIREREVWEMIGPVRQVQGKVFISIAPVVTDSLVALDHKGVNSQGLKTCGNVKTADRLLTLSIKIVEDQLTSGLHRSR